MTETKLKTVRFYDKDTGDPIEGHSWELNPSQLKFWTSKKKYVLFSGGYGCGKSLMLTIKAVQLALKYPKNYILMGRRTYPELRDTLLKEFFSYVPDALIKDYQKAEGRVTFHNGSEIIFRHLDTVAESEIRSLNLGAAFIDQGEDISKEVFIGLRGRLRREGIDAEDRKICITCNPALTWMYADFKQSPEINEDGTCDYEVIEASTLENAKHLPASYIEDLMKYPESYKKQYLYGIWDEDLFSDRIVFAREYLEQLRKHVKEPITTREGLEIFAKFIPGHRYQMGIDGAEGIYEVGVKDVKQKSDEAAITITDLTLDEEVASWSGRIPPDATSQKAISFAYMFSDPKNPITVVIEMNFQGLAILKPFHQESSNQIRIYKREEFDKRLGVTKQTEGWITSRKTKPLLISRFQEMLRVRDPKIRSKKTYEQFKSFVHTKDPNKQGMGAEINFHDDRLISALLSFWQKAPVVSGKVLHSTPIEKQDGMRIKNGKVTMIPQLQIDRERPNKWTIV